MRTLALSLLAAAALGTAALAQSPVPSAPASGAPAATPSPAAVVRIEDFAFKPDSVTVRAGDSVRFVQEGTAAHTVSASDHSFDSGNLDHGARWTHRFTKPGTYAYVCSYHPFMKGTIVVKPAE